eukprot:gene9629-1850_t
MGATNTTCEDEAITIVGQCGKHTCIRGREGDDCVTKSRKIGTCQPKFTNDCDAVELWENTEAVGGGLTSAATFCWQGGKKRAALVGMALKKSGRNSQATAAVTQAKGNFTPILTWNMEALGANDGDGHVGLSDGSAPGMAGAQAIVGASGEVKNNLREAVTATQGAFEVVAGFFDGMYGLQQRADA